MALLQIKAVVLSQFAASGLTASYQPINASGLSNPCYLIRLVNDSNQSVLISYDGTNDHEYMLAGTFYDIYGPTNAIQQSHGGQWPQGTIVYVKSGSSGTGVINLSAYYQRYS